MKYTLRDRKKITKVFNDYNEVKFTKDILKEIHYFKSIERAQKKKDDTRRKKRRAIRMKKKLKMKREREDIKMKKTLRRREELVERIKSLKSKYKEFVRLYLNCTDSFEAVYALNDDKYLVSLLEEFEEEQKIHMSFDRRCDFKEKIEDNYERFTNADIDKIWKIYGFHYKRRFNKTFDVSDYMDFAFPFPIKGIKEIDRFLDNDKTLTICLKRKH